MGNNESSASDGGHGVSSARSTNDASHTRTSRRRRRSEDSAENQAGANFEHNIATDVDSSPESSHTEASPLRKRRRVGPMMKSEGEQSSNGSTRSFQNGSGLSNLHKMALSNSTNGTRSSSTVMNGHSFSNGHSKPRPTYFGHDREEVTRLLLQTLSDLGFNGAAGTLSQESGYDLESPSVAAFRNAVIQGEWGEAEDLLFGTIDDTRDAGVSSDAGGLLLADGADRHIMKFWIRQQKYLELLEQRDTGRALHVLRTELQPLHHDIGRVHFLSRYGKFLYSLLNW